MKILILGATGLIGTAFSLKCKEFGIDYQEINHEDYDIRDTIKLRESIEEYKPDIVINNVVYIGTMKCENNPKDSFSVNSISVFELTKICKEFDIVLVHLSTHYVFDGKEDSYHENSKPKPLNVYGISKYCGELLLDSIYDKYYIFRLPTMYGPRRNKSEGIVDKFIRWIKENGEISVAIDKYDTPTYSLDATEKILDIIKNKESYGIYHISNKGYISYYNFVKEIIKLLNVECKLNKAYDREFLPLNKPLKLRIISNKINNLRGWKEALKEYIENYYGN